MVQPMFVPGFFKLLLVFLFGSGGGVLPVGIPPLEEDPAVARAAPESCVAYVGWSGMATPRADGPNEVECLLAEPEVRELVERVEREITLAIRRETRRDEEASIVAEELPKLVKIFLTRPTAVFISRVVFDPREPQVEGGIVVQVGDQAESVRASLASLERLIVRNLPPSSGSAAATAGGWNRVPLPPPAPPVAWSVEDGYLAIAVGAGMPEKIRERLQAAESIEEPQWRAAIKRKLGTERVSCIAYLDVRALRAVLSQALARELRGGPSFDQIVDALGLSRVVSLSSASGLGDQQMVSSTWIQLDGPASGLLAPMEGPGLSADDLAAVPADSTFALAFRMDPARLYRDLLSSVERVDVRARGEITRGVQEAETELGFRLSEDLLEPLGDVWQIYNSPGDGGLLITGLTAVVKVDDGERLRETLDAISSAFSRELNRSGSQRRRYELRRLTHEGERIEFINPIGDDWVVAPAWCLRKDELLLAPYPQVLKAYLSRRAGKPKADALPLAAVPAVADLFAGGRSPRFISYADTPGLFRMLYPAAPPLLTLALAELQSEGIRIDLSVLPSAAAILPHLLPSTGAAYRTEDGIVLQTRQSLPLPGALLLGAAGPVLLLRKVHAPPHESAVHRMQAEDRTEAVPLVPAPAPPPPRRSPAPPPPRR